MLSGYRLMWVVVMFDLPVVERAERKAATEFRNALLDMGFAMSQFSIYMRFCTSQAQVDTYNKRVENALPEGGKVNVHRQTIRTHHQFSRKSQTARQ
jgi:CRISPR-associated protein Cas2